MFAFVAPRLNRPGTHRHSISRAASTDSGLATSEISEALRSANGVTQSLKSFFRAESKLQAGSYDRQDIQNEILSEVRSDTFVIYTYSLSPFCTEAKRVMDDLGVPYKEIVLGPEWFLMLGRGAQKRAELGEMFGRTSLPLIFVNSNPIGGLYDGDGPGRPGLVPFLEAEPGIVAFLKFLKGIDPTKGSLLKGILRSFG